MHILISLLLTVLVIHPLPPSKPNMVLKGSKVLKGHRTKRYDCVRTYVLAPSKIIGIVTGNVSKFLSFALIESLNYSHSMDMEKIICYI